MQPSQEDAFITREVQTTPIHPPTHPQSQRAVNQSDEPSASTIHTIGYDSSSAHICITLKPQTRPRPALLCPPRIGASARSAPPQPSPMGAARAAAGGAPGQRSALTRTAAHTATHARPPLPPLCASASGRQRAAQAGPVWGAVRGCGLGLELLERGPLSDIAFRWSCVQPGAGPGDPFLLWMVFVLWAALITKKAGNAPWHLQSFDLSFCPKRCLKECRFLRRHQSPAAGAQQCTSLFAREG